MAAVGSLAVLTALFSTGCAAEESVPPRATPTVTATQITTAVPATSTPIPMVTSVPSAMPTGSPVNVSTAAPNSTLVPTGTATLTPTPTPPPSVVPVVTPTAAPAQFGVGEPIPLADLTVFVAGWDSFVGNALAEPEQGNTFVAVDLVVVNSSDTLVSVSESLQLSLLDEIGMSYSPDPIASVAVGRGAVGGVMNPGERLRGNVVFEVPASSVGIRLSLASEEDSEVLVDLGSSRSALPIPSALPGESPQIVGQIGREITTGGIALVVIVWSELTGGFLFEPQKGQKSVAVELIISNLGTLPISIASLVQTTIKDGDSRRYASDLLATLAAGGTPDGELAGGQSIRGRVGFSVPSDADGLLFSFDASVFGGRKIFVKLSTDPVSDAPNER